MSRYRAADLARLGEHARRQIELAQIAFRARDCLKAEKAGKADKSALPASRSKYGNVRIHLDGRTFDSKAEADRYCDLRLMALAGRITELICQPEYPITVNGITVAKYFADFAYYDADGNQVIEDVKSPATSKNALFRLKKKLVEALHNITITEV